MKITLLPMLICAAWLASHGFAAQLWMLSTTAEAALLKQDWETFERETRSLADFPEAHALRGHALLALNRNNDSIKQFLNLSSEPPRRNWAAWTVEFLTRHPSNEVALYLQGDAAARLGRWTEAIKWQSNALKLAPRFTLALNARGVARALIGDAEGAVGDFESACAESSKFADSQASFGTFLLANGAASEAFHRFTLALAIVPDFAIALNGSACARLGFKPGSTQIVAALNEFQRAARSFPLAASNLHCLEFMARRGPDPLSETNATPGSTFSVRNMLDRDPAVLERQIKDFTPSQLRDSLNNATRNEQWSQAWSGIFGAAKGDISKQGTTFGFDLTKNADLSKQDAQGWGAVRGRIETEMQNRGMSLDRPGITPGGADTSALLTAFASAEHRWPVVCWFGLAQQMSYPDTVPSGKNSK